LQREHGFRATLPPAVYTALQWAQLRGEEEEEAATVEAKGDLQGL